MSLHEVVDPGRETRERFFQIITRLNLVFFSKNCLNSRKYVVNLIVGGYLLFFCLFFRSLPYHASTN